METTVEERPAEGMKFAEPPKGLLKAPVDKVVALMDDSEALCAAVGELAKAGFEPEDFVVICGDAGAERLDVSGRQHGLGGRIFRVVEQLLDVHEVLVETEKHMLNGGLVISVPADEENLAEASRILSEHGAHYIHYFGKSSFRRLGA
jgi:hypothetical protein